MTSFGSYSSYYNLLYGDKNYHAETEYICQVISDQATAGRRLLDIGCGTGRHALLFAQKGFDVVGIDNSEQMLEEARSTATEAGASVRFENADIRTLSLGVKFDVIVALFHVMSYITLNIDVQNALKTTRHHLDLGGLFIFDFWYGPGVLSDRPTQRQKIAIGAGVEVRRFATPDLRVNDNTVAIDYDIIVFDRTSDKYDKIHETHLMRYYFKPEIDMMLRANRFEMVSFYEWMTCQLPNDRSWNAVVVARAV